MLECLFKRGKPEILGSLPKLEPKVGTYEVTSIDGGDCTVTFNADKKVLNLRLYQNSQEIDLNTFTGKASVEAGGSTLTLTVKEPGGKAVLDVKYYWCGVIRDGMIYETHKFDGLDWNMTKSKDKT